MAFAPLLEKEMDMKRIWILCLIYIIGVCDNSYAEEVEARTVSLSLTDAIRLAQMQSVDAAVALNELKRRIGNTGRTRPSNCRR